jgi:hypothetical protein
MMPFTAVDMIRRANEQIRSALPDAPVREEQIVPDRSARFDRVRFGIGLVLRRLADRVEPACRPAPVQAGGQSGAQ